MGTVLPNDSKREMVMHSHAVSLPEAVLSDPYNSANADAYKSAVENDFKPVKVGEFSTFSIDIDTASYTAMRCFVFELGKRPPLDSVRI
jgi:hypothetical protein